VRRIGAIALFVRLSQREAMAADGRDVHIVQGRHILWGWLQERRKVGSYDYAGCLSLPRIIYLCGNRLIQVPVSSSHSTDGPPGAPS
jgi:sucrose-6-phosphate hydrolase SacC (GH32 family)